jgi:SAM-dependent methyltransferase
MINILLYVLEIFLVIIFLGIVVLFVFWTIGNFKNKVPFVTASNAILKDIAKALEVKDSSVVYDLGCGDGRILLYLSRLNPKARYIGIENNILPLLLARVESFLYKKKTGNEIKIINGDFFKQDLSNATHIFTYLYPNIMDELLPKFEKELKPGTKLVSLSFKFSGKNYSNEVDLMRSKYKLGRKLYIYQF